MDTIQKFSKNAATRSICMHVADMLSEESQTWKNMCDIMPQREVQYQAALMPDIR